MVINFVWYIFSFYHKFQLKYEFVHNKLYLFHKEKNPIEVWVFALYITKYSENWSSHKNLINKLTILMRGGGGVIKLCLYIGTCSCVILNFEFQALWLENDSFKANVLMINSCFMFALSQKISRNQSVKWKTNIELVQWILELILLLARI